MATDESPGEYPTRSLARANAAALTMLRSRAMLGDVQNPRRTALLRAGLLVWAVLGTVALIVGVLVLIFMFLWLNGTLVQA
jgi:hypothetical protein